MDLEQVTYQMIPEATGLSRKLLEALNIELPDVLPWEVHAVTGKKLVSGRN